MKIERITENKIRVILKKDDLKNKSIDMNKILLSSPESQSLFLEILDRAKEEINFNTDGHKLLIEAFLQENDIIVCTITKFIEKSNKRKKYMTTSNEKKSTLKNCYIYQFEDLEYFCNFCSFIHKKMSLKGLFRSSILYFYKDTYYLVLNGINNSNNSLENFHSISLEFFNFPTLSKNFEFKLKEHGRIVMKNNAIATGIKHFV